MLRFSFKRRNRADPACPRDWSSGDTGEVRIEGAWGGPSGLSHNRSCRMSFLWLISTSSGPAGADHLRKLPQPSTYNGLSHSLYGCLSPTHPLFHCAHAYQADMTAAPVVRAANRPQSTAGFNNKGQSSPQSFSPMRVVPEEAKFINMHIPSLWSSGPINLDLCVSHPQFCSQFFP